MGGWSAAGVSAPLPGKWDDKGDARILALAHYDQTHRPADDLPTAQEWSDGPAGRGRLAHHRGMDAGRGRLRIRFAPQAQADARIARAVPLVDLRPTSPFPVTTFAECVGWPTGREYLMRGYRPIDPKTGRAKAGSARSADLSSTCVTATAYGWADSVTGERTGQANIGRLLGFPGDYPWRHVGRGRGVRSVAQQATDVVSPMVSAALFGPHPRRPRLGGEDEDIRARAVRQRASRPWRPTTASNTVRVDPPAAEHQPGEQFSPLTRPPPSPALWTGPLAFSLVTSPFPGARGS